MRVNPENLVRKARYVVLDEVIARVRQDDRGRPWNPGAAGFLLFADSLAPDRDTGVVLHHLESTWEYHFVSICR